MSCAHSHAHEAIRSPFPLPRCQVRTTTRSSGAARISSTPASPVGPDAEPFRQDLADAVDALGTCGQATRGSASGHRRRPRRSTKRRGRRDRPQALMHPSPANRLDVLLRHRPRSISRRSTAFHAKQRSAAPPSRRSRGSPSKRIGEAVEHASLTVTRNGHPEMDQQRQEPAGPPGVEKLVAAALDGPPQSRSGRGLQAAPPPARPLLNPHHDRRVEVSPRSDAAVRSPPAPTLAERRNSRSRSSGSGTGWVTSRSAPLRLPESLPRTLHRGRVRLSPSRPGRRSGEATRHEHHHLECSLVPRVRRWRHRNTAQHRCHSPCRYRTAEALVLRLMRSRPSPPWATATPSRCQSSSSKSR